MSGWLAKVKAAFTRVFSRTRAQANAATRTKLFDQKLVAKLTSQKMPRWSQLRRLPAVLSPHEKRRMLIVLLVFITSIIGLIVHGYFESTSTQPAIGDTYTEGLVGAPRFVNPLLAPSNDVDRDISQLVFNGLMKLTPDGKLVPDLAQSYSVSEDRKMYTFELRDDVTWHDGEPLTADDVLFTFQSIQDEDFQSPLRVSFAGIIVEQIATRTIRFTLKEPFEPFLSSLTVGIIPRHIWYQIPSASATLSDYMIKPIGTGPYQFKSLTKDNASGSIRLYALTANKTYFNGRPYIDEVHFKFYPDFTSGVEALRNQNVDGLSLLPKDAKDVDKLKRTVTIHELSMPQYTALFFNPGNNAVLTNVNVRKALATSIDRQRIIDQALNGEGTIVNSPLLPDAIGYNPDIQGFAFDQNEAKKLLDEAGWKEPDGGGFRQNDKTETLTVRLTTVDQAENTAALSIIKDNWESIGVKTQLEIIPKGVIRKEIIEPRNYEILLFGQIVGQNNDPYPFWHSSQAQHPGLNLSILANKDIDKALEDARTAVGDVKIEPLKTFQQKLQDNVFAIFLYNPTYSYPVNKNVKGVGSLTKINIPAERFIDITHWYINTSRSFAH